MLISSSVDVEIALTLEPKPGDTYTVLPSGEMEREDGVILMGMDLGELPS